MHFYDNDLYKEDINAICNLSLPWEKLKGKSVVLSGASGMIGSFLIDTLMSKNMDGLNCSIYAIGRSREKAEQRFTEYWGDEHFHFISHNINVPFQSDEIPEGDYLFHLASNTHPLQYSSDPIGTITTNIIGLKNMLDLAENLNSERIVFASSNEIYGENRGDVELFEESYCGYIDSNTLRAGYPESKRCGEALCQAYRKQKEMNIVIPRFTRTYGPTMLMSDTKAISQFIKKGIQGENIVLKSKGDQKYSYTYVADAVSGLLYILFLGKDGDAYNIADEASDIALKDLAGIIAEYVNRKVVFEIPDAAEAIGYSKATKALLDGGKLKELGWSPNYTIERGIQRTIDILAKG